MKADLVPRLETPRLSLRGWRESDFAPHAAMSADEKVMRYLGGVMDGPQSWRNMALYAGHWVLRGYGIWVVERRDDGVMLGRIGLWNPEGWLGLEVGWALARAAWGHGYATEAARTAMEWAWTVLEAERLISLIHPENAPSIRVAERLGMGALRNETLAGQSVVLFGTERPSTRATPA